MKLFVVLLGTLVCTTSIVVAMEEEQWAGPPKTLERKESDLEFTFLEDLSSISSQSNPENSQQKTILSTTKSNSR